MLSSGYFRQRRDEYRAVLDRGEEPSAQCRIDVRQMPLRVAGEDATEYIPYAVHSDIAGIFSGSVRGLYEYMVRYMIEGTRVSAHRLPQPDAVSRAMIQHLRKAHPHFPVHLLHHWCADERGGAGLYRAVTGLWQQAWKQDQIDKTPWMAATNILILKIIRAAIAHLPDEHAQDADEVMTRVLGGMYAWSLREFMQRNMQENPETACISTVESVLIPVTPIAFFYRQPADALIGDTRHVIIAYGLEPDLIPRLRELETSRDSVDKAGALALLGRERMGDHLLKRSWMRLSLRDLAEKSGQGVWMRWALDARLLDRLMANPEKAGKDMAEALQPLRSHSFAEWLLAQIEGGRKAEKLSPWRHDEITLNAFGVFDRDIRVEAARRQAERRWLDKRSGLVGHSRGAEADHALELAYREGKIAFLQSDSSQSLHGGEVCSEKHACLRVAWPDYLTAMDAICGEDMQSFLEHSFVAGVLHTLEDMDGVFVDEFGASGCLLRGPANRLVQTGAELRRQFRDWYQGKAGPGCEDHMPPAPMCMAMDGDWIFVQQRHEKLGECRIAFSPGLAQAVSGAFCAGGRRLTAGADDAAGPLFLGDVCVETLETSAGQKIQALYNHGFAITAPALAELTSALRHGSGVHEYHVDRADAGEVLRGFRLPEGGLDFIAIGSKNEGDVAPMLIVHAGKPCLGGVDMDIYEVLDPGSEAARMIASEGLSRWTPL